MSEVRIQQQWFTILWSNNQNDGSPPNNIEIPWAPRSILRVYHQQLFRSVEDEGS